MVSSCSWEEVAPLMSAPTLLQTLLLTVTVSCGFVLSKNSLQRVRQRAARINVTVVGAGPVGLTATLLALKSGRVRKLIVYEERCRGALVATPQQVSLEPPTQQFLSQLGVDFDNIEGCWHNGCFYTRLGVFLEYLLDIIHLHDLPVDIRFNRKFTRETLKELDAMPGRLLAVVCDGSHGRSATLLGISDEFWQQSCRAYGATSSIQALHQPPVPTPEIRVHNLTFDLDAYDNGTRCLNDVQPVGFHLKIFGSIRDRYMSLAVPKCESRLVKILKTVLDQSVMRNIFQACFNTYKSDPEHELSDMDSVKGMKFSPRLFEIKLSQRMESVTYIEDANLFVVAEGEAARFSNFRSGNDINLAFRGLQTLQKFVTMCACAESETEILTALSYKYNHSRAISSDFIKQGIRKTMYSF